MAKEIAVLILHGMGSQQAGFAEPMIAEVSNRLAGLDKDPAAVAWEPVFWADVLEKRQNQYLRAAVRANNLDFMGLRKFVVSALGDAAAYRRVKGKATSVYGQIHARVRDAVRRVYANELGHNARPLVFIAHSLGGQIMSNYVWDTQTARSRKGNVFERMETLAGIITFGCNMPLFTFAHDRGDLKPIRFPGNALPAAVKRKARWLNFYDRDDVLGYPLKPINGAYARVVSRDIVINVGGVLTSWNPLSHEKYWTDSDFTEYVADFLASLL